jgi:long-chain acyl-CoA synthetase
MEVKIVNPDVDGIGEVAVHSKTVMSHYLDDPELTAETLVNGWLMTGDLGRIDAMGHLQLFGRKKNVIVTEGGKNVYPEDIESAFEGVPAKEFCVFASHYLWPKSGLGDDMLVMVLHLGQGQQMTEALCNELASRNRRLPDFKRVGGYIIWERDFPRTASMKIKRATLAEEIARQLPARHPALVAL